MQTIKLKKPVEFINIAVTAGDRSSQVLPENPNRRHFAIQNNSGVAVFVSFGRDATVNGGIRLIPLAYYEPYVITSSSVHVITAPATVANDIVIIEGTKRP